MNTITVGKHFTVSDIIDKAFPSPCDYTALIALRRNKLCLQTERAFQKYKSFLMKGAQYEIGQLFPLCTVCTIDALSQYSTLCYLYNSRCIR